MQHLWVYFVASIFPVSLTFLFCWYFWRRHKSHWQHAEHEFIELQSELNRVAKDYQELEEQNRQDAQQMKNLQQEISATNQRRQESEQEIARAKRSMSNYMANIEALRLECDRLQENVNASRPDSASGSESLIASRAEVESLKEALSDSEHRSSRLGTELQLMRTIRTEFQALRQDNIDLEDELIELRQRTGPMGSMIEDLTIELQEARDDREIAQRELCHIRTELAHSRHVTNRITSTAVVLDTSPSEPVQDDQLGLVYPTPPAEANALSAIEGVSEGMEAKLNSLGVFQYSQIANWTDDQVEVLSQRLGFQDRIIRDRWREQAAAILSPLQEVEEVPTQIPSSDEATEELQATLPSPEDEPETDSKPRVQGFAGLSRAKGSNKDDEDPSLFAMPPTLEHERNDSEIGIPHTTTPADVDELTSIKGVGKVLEKRLHAVGIYRYKQVAQWTDEQVEDFSQRLSFHDRIQRDRWREQCIDLHDEKYGEKLPCPGRPDAE